MNTTDNSIRVLLIEDNSGDVRLIKEMLQEAKGRKIVLEQCATLTQGLQALSKNDFNMLLLDLTLPDSIGFDTFVKVYTQNPQIPIVVLTGTNDEELAIKSVRTGAQDYLIKGQIDSSLLSRSIFYAIERAGLLRVVQQELIERKAMESMLRKINRALRVLSECNEIVVRSKEEKVLAEKICGAIIALGEYQFAWVAFAEPNDGTSIQPIAIAGSKDGNSPEEASAWFKRDPDSPLNEALTTGRDIVCDDVTVDKRCSHLRAEADKMGYRSFVILPLLASGRTLGILQICSREPARFDREELKLLDELKEDVSYAIVSIKTEKERNRAVEEIKMLARFPSENPSPILRINRDGIVLNANIASSALLQNWNCSLGDCVPTFWREAIEEVLTTLKRKTVEIKLDERTFSFFVVPISESGYVNLYGLDITERKRGEEALRSEQMMLARTEAIAQIGSWEWEIATDTVTWSDELFRIFQRDPREGAPSFAEHPALYQPDDMARLQQAVTSAIADGTPYELELRAIRKDGTIRTCVARGIPERAPDGRIVRLVGSLQNITERKQTEEALQESLERFQLANHATFNTIWDWNLQTDALLWNENIQLTFGYKPEEIEPGIESWTNRIHPEDLSRIKAGIHAAIDLGKQSWSDQYRFRRKDGSYAIVVDRGYISRDTSGKPIRMIGAMEDITERKRAEDALTYERNLLRALMDNTPDHIYFKDINSSFIRMSKAQSERFGLSNPALAEGKSDFDFFTEEHACLAYKDEQEIIKTGRPLVNLEEKETWPDGKVTWVSTTKVPLRDIQGQISGTFGISRDITDRKQIEIKLRESEERLTDIIYSVGDWIWEVDENWRYTYSSKKCEELFGCTPEEVVGKTPFDFMLPDEVERVKKIYFGVIFNKALLKDLENWKIGKNGKQICLLTNGVHVLDEEGNIKGYRGVDKDITEHKLIEHARKRGEEALRSSNEFNEVLLQALPFGMEIVDEQGTILFLSDSMKNLTGRDAVGHTCWSIYKDDGKQCLDCPLRKGIEFGSPEVLESFDVLGGRIFQISHVGIMYQRKQAMLEVFVEVTEQRKLQNQFLQSQKIQSIGTLAGGIAHDFNNILGIILAYSSLLERCADDQQKIIESSAAISKAVGRGAALVRQILTFARQSDVSFQPLSIPDFIREICSMLEETFPEIIEINNIIEKKIPFISADHTQMHQALLNLCVNARDAMPTGGTLSIKVSTVEQSMVRKHFMAASAERYVCISVSDTGTGMDAKTKSRAFDPFFTTKEKGKGTGLGLSVAYGVMQTHHGFIDVESEEGKGTTFFLYLPVPGNPEAGQKIVKMESSDITGGTETLLIVEDEEVLRKILQTLLENQGYHVFAAADGVEAVKVYLEHQNQIDLVLTDVGLPKMTGIEEFKQLIEINPNIKVLLASGFLHPEMKSEMFKAGAKGFIQKPYKPEDVLREIRLVLEMK